MVIRVDKTALLKRYFGHSEFRTGQKELIEALLSGRDVLGVMPTGAGKSICYQLSALLLPDITVVISPLISLMKDQVNALTESGISAAYLNSSLTMEQQREVVRRAYLGAYKLIYVAPERLNSPIFVEFASTASISLLAVDEAHCVSQWGQDFRPSYLKISEFARSLPHRPVIGAFTATATAKVKEDIKTLIGLDDPLCITTGFDRPNLYFDVVHPRDKKAHLLMFLRSHLDQSGIVYCATRKTVENLCDFLKKHNIAATRYHAGLEGEERKRNQDSFIHDEVGVMVATNAFGMGIDKSNVGFVVHYNMPKDIESYYQEAGRAGRDGENAYCLLMFSNSDVKTAEFLINNSSENEELSADERELLRQRDLKRLKQMVSYCKTSDCLRGYLLKYFGERYSGSCGNCGNCNGEVVRKDITVEAQKILSAVIRVENKFNSGLGITLIVRMLHGSRDQRVLQYGLDEFSTYGIMHDIDRMKIREYIDFLITKGYLFLTDGEYPVLRATQDANRVLFQKEKVIYTGKKVAMHPNKLSKKNDARESSVSESDLLSRLKALRTKVAHQENVPAYIIFSNAALTDMASKQPRTLQEFLQVSGVGAIKTERYGEIFINEINKWKGGEDRE